MKKRSRAAFTMIELVFVIVVIGILSAIAVPKFAATRDDAVVTKGRTAVAAMRSALASERQKRILKGDFTRINGAVLEGLIEYGLGSRWSRSGDTFTFTSSVGSCAFTIPNDKNTLEKGTCSVTGMSDL
jgi:general secretion pathway protein G